ncbi:hypothetical protein PS1_024787 [Malus domestica]
MAMHVSSACFSALSERRVLKVRAVASENVTTEDDKVKLGGSNLKVTRLGIGTSSGMINLYYSRPRCNHIGQSGYRKMKVAKAAFDVNVDGGITFFDTAEVCGSRASFGAVNSETLLGRFIKERKQKDPRVDVAVATKFAALLWRLGRQSAIAALKDSLNCLELSSMKLYQLHWYPEIWGNEGYLDGLGDAVEQGLVKAVNYSLIYKAPKENGVKFTCDELGITLIAYSPIAQGELQPLLKRIKEIGEKYSKINTQVVLNWLIAQGNVVPIPGAKKAEQVAEFASSLGWRLNTEEVAELRALVTEIKPVTGFPVEKL